MTIKKPIETYVALLLRIADRTVIRINNRQATCKLERCGPTTPPLVEKKHCSGIRHADCHLPGVMVLGAYPMASVYRHFWVATLAGSDKGEVAFKAATKGVRSFLCRPA